MHDAAEQMKTFMEQTTSMGISTGANGLPVIRPFSPAGPGPGAIAEQIHTLARQIEAFGGSKAEKLARALQAVAEELSDLRVEGSGEEGFARTPARQEPLDGSPRRLLKPISEQ